jgi:hypothetical protein
MQEEVDNGGGREPMRLPEADGIDAHDLVIVRGSDEAVERIE